MHTTGTFLKVNPHRFGSEFSQTETNYEVELQQEFQPAGLLPCQDFGSGKIFEILVLCDDITWDQSSFEVMVPGLERFKDGQEFLVVHVVV